MLRRATYSAAVLILGVLVAQVRAADSATLELDKQFSGTVRPFVNEYCLPCHSGTSPEADLDLSGYASLSTVVRDHTRWATVLEKLSAKEMPPDDAKKHPSPEARQAVIDWITAMRQNATVANAGDPGVVLARRLSNAEYNYTICDLTGVDMRPAREFPVDPTNPEGFDNSGESLSMSPTLLAKYLQAAREVAEHLVLKPNGIAFASHPMLVETDRDKYCVAQIMDFYSRQNMNFADYFAAAWRYEHRAALGKPDASLTEVAAESKVSAKYLATVWTLLEGADNDFGPIAKLRRMWRKLPAPDGSRAAAKAAREGCDRMRDYVVQLRKKLELRFANISGGKRLSASSQPMLMWKNRQYATHRRSYELGALQIDGQLQTQTAKDDSPADEPGAEDEFGPGHTMAVKNKPGDPDLFVPADQPAEYEAAFATFCDVFPDAFVVSERGRNYFDKSKDRGRYLSAGFHNVMGYFRDDQPLYELILDDAQQKELDEYWRELEFIAAGCERTYTQFYLYEGNRELREAIRTGLTDGIAPKDRAITSERMIRRVKEDYLARAQSADNETVVVAVKQHFDSINDTIRWIEQARREAEPTHLEAILDLAARAYRRPLTDDEKEDLRHFYRSLRDDTGLNHEDAIRDTLVSVLMSPDFCYRLDLATDSQLVQPLSDVELASRLSFFLWSSLPDAKLFELAEVGELHSPESLADWARGMMRDERIVRLATEFGGNWLDFRRFEELNTVDREHFTDFNDELRAAMYQEPLHFMVDLLHRNGSILDFLYADHAFVNAALAKHYGISNLEIGPNEWVRVDNAHEFGRGGVLPMAAFLTKNAPGLRTSPVKRGYWVVKRVLGEVIPPPPAAVPELPRAEKDLGDLTLRQVLERHRADPSCAACHQRFDAMGLVFEGFGPVGERRETDLAGHAIDTRATFPGGSEGTGVDGLRDYIRQHRQDDFVDNLCRKLLAYALGRSLMLSDDATIADMKMKLASNDYRIGALVESIVTSRQFTTKRGGSQLAQSASETPPTADR